MLTVFFSALLAGIVAIAVTVAIERFGGVVGGFLGTLPTTIVPAAAGMYIKLPHSEAFVDAVSIAPVGMLLNVGFLWLWRVLPARLPAASLRSRLVWMSTLSLTAWMVGAVGVVQVVGLLRSSGLPTWIAGLAATGTMVAVGTWACLEHVPAPKGTQSVAPLMLLARGLAAAIAIGVAVLLARSEWDLVAGVASVFPAIFFTSMVSLWLSQGEAVPGGAIGPMMLGSTAVGAYALLAAAWLPLLGVVAGSVLAWAVSALLVTLPASWWLTQRRQAQQTVAAEA